MYKLQATFGVVILVSYIITCNQKNTVTLEEKKKVLLYIRGYIDSVSKFKEYGELQKQFYCFYQNAINAKREFYIAPADSLKESLIGLDSLLIINSTRDTVLLMYIEKFHNYESEGYHFNVTKLYAYKKNEYWKFYDHLASAMYLEKYYSLEMARNNERIWFALDGGWLLDWRGKGKIRASNSFLSEYLYSVGGLCDEWSWKHNRDLCDSIVKRKTPPDNLYYCK